MKTNTQFNSVNSFSIFCFSLVPFALKKNDNLVFKLPIDLNMPLILYKCKSKSA